MDHFQQGVGDTLHILHHELSRLEEEIRHRSPADADIWVPSLDRALRASFEQADALRRFLVVHRTPRVAPYDPLARLRLQSAHFVPAHDSLAPDPPVVFEGDSEQVVECFRLILGGFEAAGGESYAARLYLDAEEPRIDIGFDDRAPAPLRFTFSNALVLEAGATADRWTAASNGGQFIVLDGGIRVTFSGTMPLPPPLPLADALLPDMRKATNRLLPWRGAIGHFEPGHVDFSELIDLYRNPIVAAREHVADACRILRNRQ